MDGLVGTIMEMEKRRGLMEVEEMRRENYDRMR